MDSGKQEAACSAFGDARGCGKNCKRRLESAPGQSAWCSEKLISDAGRCRCSVSVADAAERQNDSRVCRIGLSALARHHQIDLQAADALPVFNAPYKYPARQSWCGEIIAPLRHSGEDGRPCRAMARSAAGCAEIRGKPASSVTAIGSQVSVLRENLGMSVLFHDIVDILPPGNARRANGLEELLEAQTVTPCSDTPETRHLMTCHTKNEKGRGSDQLEPR